MSGRIELKPNDTILFIGDSITDAGRRESPYQPLGYGYVHFIAYRLLAKYPELNLNIINTGISGNTVRHLNSRWQQDCLDHKPDILSVMIGINDICRKYENRLNDAVAVDEYETTYKKLLSSATKQLNCRLILIEPFLFCDDEKNPAYQDLKAYIDVVHRLAGQFGADVIPLQALIYEKLKQIPPIKWSDDMVHPFLWAHAWIAQRWLDEIAL
jgi:lysophospholipase L1-like esterase